MTDCLPARLLLGAMDWRQRAAPDTGALPVEDPINPCYSRPQDLLSQRSWSGPVLASIVAAVRERLHGLKHWQI